MIIHITSFVVKMLCPVGRENAKKRKAGRSPSSFSSYPQVSGVFDEREILVLYAADIDFFIKFIEINISK